MSWKVSMLVNHSDARKRSAGWSCTFYSSAETRGRIITDANELATAMDRLMGRNSTTVAVRMNELKVGDNAIIAGRRVPVVYRFENQNNTTSPTGTESDFPETAIVFRDHAGINGSRTWWLNGVWDDRITDGGAYTPSGDYRTAIAQLYVQLLNDNNFWRLRLQNRNTPRPDVVSATAGGVVTTGQPHGYNGTLYVRIIGSRNSNQLNGRWKVNVLTANTFQLLSIGSKNVVYAEGDCKVYAEQLVLYPYAVVPGLDRAYEVVRSGNHKVGRPFDPHSGRRIRPRSVLA